MLVPLREVDDVALKRWEKQEESIALQERNDVLRAQLEEELDPSRTLLHKMFILINILTISAALLMGIGQFIGIYFSHVGLIRFVLRIYVIMLCVLVVFNELNWTFITRESVMLRYWITRGAMYAFIGILGLEEIEASPATKNEDVSGRDKALNFVFVIAWIMVGLGALYFVMGLFCGQILYTRVQEDYKQRRERSTETRRATETYRDVSSEVV
jgi:hypothetical protein